MPEHIRKNDAAFIPRELRPAVSPDDATVPPLPIAASANELRKRAAESMGEGLRAELGLNDDAGRPTREQIFGRSADVIHSIVDGEAVLLDLGSGMYFSLNAVGAAIWERLTGGHDLGAVHAAVCERFDVPESTAWAELQALIRELEREKLVVEMGRADAAR